MVPNKPLRVKILTLPLLSAGWQRLDAALETGQEIEVQLEGKTYQGTISEKYPDRLDAMQRPVTDFLFRANSVQ